MVHRKQIDAKSCSLFGSNSPYISTKEAAENLKNYKPQSSVSSYYYIYF